MIMQDIANFYYSIAFKYLVSARFTQVSEMTALYVMTYSFPPLYIC